LKLQLFIEGQGRSITLAEGEHVFRQGDREPRLFLVKDGHLKAYYLRGEDGREHIKSLVGPGSIISSTAAMEEGGTCTFSLAALGPASLVAVPFAAIAESAKSDLDLANEVIGFLMLFARRKEQREYELLCLSAEDRYLRFLEEQPAADAEVSQADIAAYIGITPQALSRIKRRLAKRRSPLQGRQAASEGLPLFD